MKLLRSLCAVVLMTGCLCAHSQENPEVLEAVTEKDYSELLRKYDGDRARAAAELRKLSRQRVAEMTRELTVKDLENLKEKHGVNQRAMLAELNALFRSKEENRRRFQVDRQVGAARVVEKVDGSVPYEDEVPGVRLADHVRKHAVFRFVVLSNGVVDRIVQVDGDALNKEIDKIIEAGGPQSEFFKDLRADIERTRPRD